MVGNKVASTGSQSRNGSDGLAVVQAKQRGTLRLADIWDIINHGGKPMSLESMLASLTPQEKLDAMNILWRDLSTNPAGFPSPDWHGDVLSERIKNPSGKPSLPIDAAFEDVRERLNERRTQG